MVQAPPEFEATPSDLVVIVKRTRCLGSCPVASTEVRANGEVVYKGTSNVAHKGEVRFTADARSVGELWMRVRDLDFFELDDRFAMMVRDVPSTHITVVANGKSKTIVNRWSPSGRDSVSAAEWDVHAALDLLALDVERLSGSARLLYGYIP